jgi:hypothetical protein
VQGLKRATFWKSLRDTALLLNIAQGDQSGTHKHILEGESDPAGKRLTQCLYSWPPFPMSEMFFIVVPIYTNMNVIGCKRRT